MIATFIAWTIVLTLIFAPVVIGAHRDGEFW